MAFNTEKPRAEYTASEGQTTYPFLFKIFTDADLVVYQTPNGQNPDDVVDRLTLAVDYTVTINGDDGGEITLTNGATLNDSVTLLRSLDITRSTEYQQNGDLRSDTLNADQEYQTYLLADQKASNDRVIRLAENAQGVDNYLPAPIGESYLRWNADGTSLENDTTIPTNVQTAVDAATASATSATASATSATASANSATASANSATASSGFADDAAASALEAASYIGKAQTDAPTLSGAITVVENNPIVVTIDNYANYSADAVWSFVTTSGTANMVGADITISSGSVVADEPNTLTVNVYEPSHAVSADTVHNFTVTNSASQPDDDYVVDVNGALFNATNYPTTAGGYVDTTVGDEGLVATLKGGDGASNVSTIDSVPTMTSNTAPSGIAFASTTNTDAFKVFSDNTASLDKWQGAGGVGDYIGYIEDVARVRNKYSLFADLLQFARMPKQWVIEESNDTTNGTDGTWTTTHTQNVDTTFTAEEKKYFTYTNSTAYKAWRLRITVIGLDAFNDINEIEIIEAQATSTATYNSNSTAKADLDGDWNGTQGITDHITSELPDILSSADATTALFNGNIPATDTIYLGDGTDFETVVATGATYDIPTDKTTFTHGQTFTPTFACKQDNASVSVSFDDVNDNAIAKKATGHTFVGTANSGLLVSSLDPFGDGSLIAKYELDTDATDTLNAYNGTPANVTYTTGSGGVFNESGDFTANGRIDTGYLHNSGSTRSVSMFFKTSSTGLTHYLFGGHDAAGGGDTSRLTIGVNATNDLYIHIGDDTAVGWNDSTIPMDSYLDGLFHHLVVTISGTVVKLYIDNVLINTYTSTKTLINAVSITERIGAVGAYVGSFWNGNIDQVELYSKELNASEVGELYVQGSQNLSIKELLDSTGIVANTGTQISHEVTHKDVATKTTAISIALTELP